MKEFFTIFGLNLYEYVTTLQRVKRNGSTVVHYDVGVRNSKNK